MTGARVPQVFVTLAPGGELQIEVPGMSGSRRRIAVRGRELEATLLRVLHAQQAQRVALGEDGSPTEQQVRHWERHGVFADSRCPFCVGEGRREGSGRGRKGTVLAEHGSGGGAVVVRRLPVKAKGKAPGRKIAASAKSARELGL